MLESTASLLPNPKKNGEPLKVVCIGLEEYPLAELERLLDTLGVKVAGRVIVSLRKINPATYVNSGKLDEAKMLAETQDADAIVVDIELSPNQLRNVEKAVGIASLDRPGIILEIFSRHARSKEAKTQVELARLKYLLPRLAHLWSHFERQRGGGVGNKGMGEKQIEVDRRLVKKRMQILQDRLKEIEKERNIRRAGRKEVLKVALVGYTNAGKSTLLNALTHSKVLAEDKLFATLDPSVRTLTPDSHPPIVAVDTVGFVSRLPHDLVASFRSTLEEVQQADLLVHVVDASSENARQELEVTDQVMKELDAHEKPRLVVLNKIDLVGTTPAAKNRVKLISPGSQMVSAINKADVKKLREVILNHFQKELTVYEVVIPYSESKIESQIRQHGSVEKHKHLEKGTFMRVRMDEGWAKKLGLAKFKT